MKSILKTLILASKDAHKKDWSSYTSSKSDIRCALIIGKEYRVNTMRQDMSSFNICSEVLSEHTFSTNKQSYYYYGNYFEIKA